MKKFKLKEDTHIILKMEDIEKYLGEFEQIKLMKYLNIIYDGRTKDGKEINKYYLCNQDEHYSRDVFDLIKRNIMLREVIENDLIGLGEDGEWFAIEREVFNELFKELDPMDPSSGFDEEELMKLLLIDWVEFYSCEKAIDVDVKEWYQSILTPYVPYDDGEEYETYPKDTTSKGKHYTFHCWYDVK